MMRKSMVVVIGLALALALAGCGGDTVTNPGPTTPVVTAGMVPLSYQASNLACNGDTLLASVVGKYTSVAADGTLGRVKGMADYMLFPVGDFSGAPGTKKSFASRMVDVCYGDDNVVKILAVQSNYGANGPLASAGAVRPGAARSGARGMIPMDEEPFEGYNECIDAVAAGIDCLVPGLGSLLGGIFGGPSEEEQFRNRVDKQLDKIGKSIDQMRSEMRQGFSQVNQRLDVVLDDLNDIRGDMNIVKTGLGYVIGADLQNAKDSFHGFELAFQGAGTPAVASNVVYTYLAMPEFSQNMLNYISGAKTMQQWMVANNAYSNEAWMESARATNVANVVADFFCTGFNRWGQAAFNYQNPKLSLNIGLGNFSYLAKMILARLEMNSYLYGGQTLVDNNDTLARQYLQLLETEFSFTAVVNSIISQMRAQRGTFVAEVTTQFKGMFPGLPSDTTASFWHLSRAGVRILEYPNQPTTIAFIDQDFKRNVMAYMGIVAAQMIAFEVRLRSYMK